MYPSSREVVSLRQLEDRVTRVRTRPRELVMQANQCTPYGLLKTVDFSRRKMVTRVRISPRELVMQASASEPTVD